MFTFIYRCIEREKIGGKEKCLTLFQFYSNLYRNKTKRNRIDQATEFTNLEVGWRGMNRLSHFWILKFEIYTFLVALSRSFCFLIPSLLHPTILLLLRLLVNSCCNSNIVKFCRFELLVSKSRQRIIEWLVNVKRREEVEVIVV